MTEAIPQEVLQQLAVEEATRPEQGEIATQPEPTQEIEQTEPTENTDDFEALRQLLQTQSPSEIVEWINALVYGDSGVGKTFLGGTADDDERTSPLLVLDVEGGVTTLRHRSRVDVIEIRSMKELERVHEKLYHSIKRNKIMYGTVMIDSLPELADIDMRLIMRQAKDKNPETTDIDVPSPREWGKQRNHMRLILRAFKDLPCHLYCTALANSHTEENQPTKHYPAFAGKLRLEIPGFVDIVGFLTSTANVNQDITRRMQVVGTNRVIAKDRTQALGKSVENPTIPKLWDLIDRHNKEILAT